MTLECHWAIGFECPGSHGQPITHFYLVKEASSVQQAVQIACKRADAPAERVDQGNLDAPRRIRSIYAVRCSPIGHWNWQEYSENAHSPTDRQPYDVLSDAAWACAAMNATACR
jgi:hypothetical protein